jgi:hypothetical protein
MIAQIKSQETGGYSNAARIKLHSRLMNFSADSVAYNRDEYRKWKHPYGAHGNMRFIFAFTGHPMREVMRWKVDLGGGKISTFEGAVKFALYKTLEYNAQTYFSSYSPDQIGNLVTAIIAKHGHMTLYAVVDALESLINREEPCNLESYGFDAKAITQALGSYWRKAKEEYYAAEKLTNTSVHHDFKPGDPVPEYITVLREKMENKFGVVYDEESSREAMRVAAEKYRREHEQGSPIDFS